jgi:hypothetical protein
MRAHCGLMGVNDCKCSRDQRHTAPFETRDNKFLVTHPITTLLNFHDRTPKRHESDIALTQFISLYSIRNESITIIYEQNVNGKQN